MTCRKLIGDKGIILFFELLLLLIIVLDCNSIFRVDTAILINLQAIALNVANGIAALLIILHLIKDTRKFTILEHHIPLFLVSVIFTFEFNALNAIKHGGHEFMGYTLVFVNLITIRGSAIPQR